MAVEVSQSVIEIIKILRVAALKVLIDLILTVWTRTNGPLKKHHREINQGGKSPRGGGPAFCTASQLVTSLAWRAAPPFTEQLRSCKHWPSACKSVSPTVSVILSHKHTYQSEVNTPRAHAGLFVGLHFEDDVERCLSLWNVCVFEAGAWMGGITLRSLKSKLHLLLDHSL